MISKNLKRIREFPSEKSELLKSHHFLFNGPLNKTFKNAKVSGF
tara:strand:- start:348 stop:479 length:132 start_codon:yes stop_codon:yes gene_type:complete